MEIFHHVDAASAVGAVRAIGKRIVTFVGFSGGQYPDPAALQRAMRETLARFDPEDDVICAGATAAGIGAIYPLARPLGFHTIGIVSSLAETENAAFSPDVEVVHVVKDDVWGGRKHDGELSPTSAAIVGASAVMVLIGGGSIALAEAAAARERSIPLIEVPRDEYEGLR
jgi:hypothetical protein